MTDAKNDIPSVGQIAQTIKTVFTDAYETLKTIIKVEDSNLKGAVADMMAQDGRHVLTQEFLRDGLRQGCTAEFDELNVNNPEPEKEKLR